METLLLTFGFFIAVVFAMSIGFLIKGNALKGSCGGISALGMKKCVTVKSHAITSNQKLQMAQQIQKKLLALQKKSLNFTK